MKRNIVKILLLSATVFVAVICFDNIVGVLAGSSMAEKLKGKILLQVEDNGEAWYVNPDNLEKYYLGKPNDAFELMQILGRGITNEDLNKIEIAEANFDGIDTDGDGIRDRLENSIGTNIQKTDSDDDGYSDKEELLSGYNPMGAGKIDIDDKFSANLAGYIVLQIENSGEAWYINPDNLKRYYLGKPTDAFNIMRKLGLGVNNINLAKIVSYNDNSEFSNDNIVKNNTVNIEDNKRRYTDRENDFSFEYEGGWSIKKYPENQNVVFITDSKKDFFLEGRAIIMITFVESTDFELDNFKLPVDGLAETTEEEVNNRNTIEQVYELDYTDKISTTIEGEKGFISVVLITGKNGQGGYTSG